MNPREHPLDPLLRPTSIAVLGASERPGSVGRRTVENLLQGRFTGRLYAVNPGHDTVLGVACYPTLADLPETAEHVALTVGDARIEAALDSVIEHGARAVTMMSSLALRDDQPPLLRERIARRLSRSRLLVCGANGMGFYNFADGVWMCGFDTRANHARGGSVTLISHSGSGMSGIVDCEGRIDFNLAVSTGQELGVTMDQYVDWALDRPETRVIGLFMETVRRPGRMAEALAKAAAKRVPVVVLKVGRTELSARLAVSHSGAIAGRDDTYRALFDRHGVQRVGDMHELATTLMMFAQPHPIGRGGLVALHDSGGERQLLIDLADDLNVPLTGLAPATVQHLEGLLDPGLPPVNPLDAWGAGGPGADGIMRESLAALMSDPNAAMGAVVHDRAPNSGLYREYFDYLRAGHAASGKPAFLVANHQGSGSDDAAVALTREGFPVLDGLRPFLVGARCLLSYRDFCARPRSADEPADADTVEKWRPRLAKGVALGEFEAFEMLRDFGLPMNPTRLVESEASLVCAAEELGYPLVLKTAEPGILHKTDCGGVHLGIETRAQLAGAYADLSARLGPKVLAAPMVDAPGVEMVLGVIRDEQFGPLAIVGFGGVNVEAIRDVACALPPFDRATARHMLGTLRSRPLLEGLRDRPAADVEAFCAAAQRLSALAAALGDVIAEIDVNPVIVHAEGCVAVDALVVGRRPKTANGGPRSGILDENQGLSCDRPRGGK